MMERSRKLKRKKMIKLMSVTLVMGMMSQGFAGVVSAKETRAAIAVTVEGTVLVTKAGGSNAYRAFEEMSLSQGDHLKTEDGSSIVLQIVDQEDEITIGPNSDLYISSLLQTDSNAKKSKFKMWAGSVWFKVKKLVSDDDEFEVETPTAVMGVRGSNGYIEAKLGQIYAMMTSGVLEAQSTTSSSDNGAGSSTTPIYPG
ncbi:MAG: FecR protein, partial [Paenibacillus sp.]|nr:FecR protein [Paenibacillus sp.]